MKYTDLKLIIRLLHASIKCFTITISPYERRAKGRAVTPTNNALSFGSCFVLAVSAGRAGGKGTAGTAIAVPVLREKKWRRLDFNLRVRYRVASPSSSP